MKTAIIYYSQHHRNTEKLVKAIAAKHPVDLIDVTKAAAAGKSAAAGAQSGATDSSAAVPDLGAYDRIGIASGVYAGNVAKPLIRYCEENLPEGRDVFYIFTSAMTGESALAKIRSVAAAKGARELGAYNCKGYNTFGPFKLVGGTSKGHPTEEEIRACVEFFEGLEG